MCFKFEVFTNVEVLLSLMAYVTGLALCGALGPQYQLEEQQRPVCEWK
jgi:hypothetical protein